MNTSGSTRYAAPGRAPHPAIVLGHWRTYEGADHPPSRATKVDTSAFVGPGVLGFPSDLTDQKRCASGDR